MLYFYAFFTVYFCYVFMLYLTLHFMKDFYVNEV